MEKKKKSTLFTRLFGNRNKVTDFMTEEQLQSPGRLILKNFLHNRLGMIGLIVFLLIFLLVMIGPKFYTLDLSYQDNTQLESVFSGNYKLHAHVLSFGAGFSF